MGLLAHNGTRFTLMLQRANGKIIVWNIVRMYMFEKGGGGAAGETFTV